MNNLVSKGYTAINCGNQDVMSVENTERVLDESTALSVNKSSASNENGQDTVMQFDTERPEDVYVESDCIDVEVTPDMEVPKEGSREDILMKQNKAYQKSLMQAVEENTKLKHALDEKDVEITTLKQYIDKLEQKLDSLKQEPIKERGDTAKRDDSAKQNQPEKTEEKQTEVEKPLEQKQPEKEESAWSRFVSGVQRFFSKVGLIASLACGILFLLGRLAACR